MDKLLSPINFSITTTQPDEEVITNASIARIFPQVLEGSSLTGKMTFFFNGDNLIEFNNSGILQGLLASTVWSSNDNVISVNSIKIHTPCTFTLSIDFE